MIYSLSIFVLAFVGMVFMMLVKFYEIKTGSDFIFIRWRKKIDYYAHVWFAKTKIFVLKKEHQIVSLIKGIPLNVLNIVSRLHNYLHSRYGKHIDMIKGRNTPTNKGSVSFFVSAISEYKNEIKKQ